MAQWAALQAASRGASPQEQEEIRQATERDLARDMLRTRLNRRLDEEARQVQRPSLPLPDTTHMAIKNQTEVMQQSMVGQASALQQLGKTLTSL